MWFNHTLTLTRLRFNHGPACVMQAEPEKIPKSDYGKSATKIFKLGFESGIELTESDFCAR
jgi:hypothetical protein